ncbi:alpha/beta hydrolase [Massilia sp.]|uniref:alpha/beta hydrolase n=1 Tax=Massilia sp. TaxID=1882437 RepID=UPI00352EDB3B
MCLDPVLNELYANNPVNIPTPIDWVAVRQFGKKMPPHLLGSVDVLAVGSVADLKIAGEGNEISARVYRPHQAPAMTLIYLHGGGWAVGELDTIDHTARKLCTDLSATIVSVDYRLAPENPFPAAYNDALAAARWVLEHAQELGGHPDTVVIGGDSAGGNLAAAVAIGLRDDEAAKLRVSAAPRAKLKAQLLLFPSTDLRPSSLTTPSCIADLDPSLKTKVYEECISNYLQGENANDWRASPIVADLRGLPPALVVVLTVDPLRDSGVAYAQRLRTAGVVTELIEYPHMTHGFIHLFNAVPATRVVFDDLIDRFRLLVDAVAPSAGHVGEES